MIFDTDVLIWVLRGNAKAARALDNADERAISIATYMELLQGARDKRDIKSIKSFLVDMGFGVLPLSENIGHRASIYMEEYSLSTSISMGDALIAATAIEANEQLLTANDKHYKAIKELDIKRFRP
jgi:hypothetical protein